MIWYLLSKKSWCKSYNIHPKSLYLLYDKYLTFAKNNNRSLTFYKNFCLLKFKLNLSLLVVVYCFLFSFCVEL